MPVLGGVVLPPPPPPPKLKLALVVGASHPKQKSVSVVDISPPPSKLKLALVVAAPPLKLRSVSVVVAASHPKQKSVFDALEAARLDAASRLRLMRGAMKCIVVVLQYLQRGDSGKRIL